MKQTKKKEMRLKENGSAKKKVQMYNKKFKKQQKNKKK